MFKLGRNDESFIDKDDEAKADELFLKQTLFNKEKISEREYKNLLNKIKKNETNLIRFMSVLITFYKINKIIKIENYDNLNYLSKILDYVLNTCRNNKTLFDICFMVIFVAEKTIYISEDNIYIKHYLCKSLSKNTLFQESEFWLELIDQKVEMTTNKNVKNEIEKKDKEKEEEKTNTLMSGFKNYFFSNKIKENQKLESEILFRQLYEEKLPIYTVEILEEYMHHFSSFNLEHKKTSELIVDLSTKYKFDNKYVTFFLAQLNSNLYSIKQKNSSINEGAQELDYDKLAEIDEDRPELTLQEKEEVEIQVKYEGYIKMQEAQVEKFKKLESKMLSEDIDYDKLYKYNELSIDFLIHFFAFDNISI